MSAAKKRYAQVGIGSRSRMYTKAIAQKYSGHCEVVGLCDVNPSRMAFNKAEFLSNGPDVPTYAAADFDRMIAETKPDVVIVTSVDATHDRYICRAMELGCDVVTEKPMTTDEEKCRRVLKTIARTGRNCQVTFNYRYSPPRSQLKEILASDVLGTILSVDFGWLLNTHHGADYFRRWHRRRENSGSLLVHKATHHFDLVNWALDDVPEEVFAHGTLRYYVPETAQRMGLSGRSERCHDCPVSDRCNFFLDLAANKYHKGMYLDSEHEDGYFRDACVFSDQIDIWDSMSAAVRYRSGTLMNYMLHAYSPYEGYRIAFNGTKGRLEHLACESTYVSGDGTVPGELDRRNVTMTLIPEFEKPRDIEVRTASGGHGGGDALLLDDVFNPNPPADPLRRKAGPREGAYSILIGIAARRSIESGEPVKIAELLQDAPI